MTTELGPNGQAIIDEVTAPAPFGDQDRAILEFERGRWLAAGAKHGEIIERFAMTPTRYYIRLNWIIDQPEALEYDAAHVNRLRNLREKRREVRTRGTAAAGVATRPDPRGTRPALLVVKP